MTPYNYAHSSTYLYLLISTTSTSINFHHLAPPPFSPVTLGRMAKWHSKSTQNETVPGSKPTNTLVQLLKPNVVII